MIEYIKCTQHSRNIFHRQSLRGNTADKQQIFKFLKFLIDFTHISIFGAVIKSVELQNKGKNQIFI